MGKEGIMLSHKMSSKGIEVDWTMIEVIEKLKLLVNAKGIQRFLGHVRF